MYENALVLGTHNSTILGYSINNLGIAQFQPIFSQQDHNIYTVKYGKITFRKHCELIINIISSKVNPFQKKIFRNTVSVVNECSAMMHLSDATVVSPDKANQFCRKESKRNMLLINNEHSKSCHVYFHSHMAH